MSFLPCVFQSPIVKTLQQHTATVECCVGRAALTVHKNGFIKGSPCYFKPGESDHIQGCRDPGSQTFDSIATNPLKNYCAQFWF